MSKTYALSEAIPLFENDPAQSLDQIYYSYQSCHDAAKARRESDSSRKDSKSRGLGTQ